MLLGSPLSAKRAIARNGSKDWLGFARREGQIRRSHICHHGLRLIRPGRDSRKENPMISTDVSPRRLGLAIIVGLGLSVLWLPALAGEGSAVPAAEGNTPLVLADNQAFKSNRTWNPNAWNNNGNWNRNWNNNWNNNKNWNKNNKNWNKNYSNKHWNKNNFYVRTWRPRPYYGQFFGGIVLGSILTAAAIGVAPPPPNAGLCWYWADPYGYRGYWDYCAPYPPY
jgi:hypothetical protein